MTKKYDVVVVGGGPGGLMAAKTAQQEGLSVLLVEQKKEIARISRTCAEGLITRPNCDGETVTVEGEKIIFHSNDFSINYPGPWVDMKQSMRISPNGSKMVVERDVTPVARIFNKEVLLENLLSDVEKSGCDIENETMGVKAENTNGEVVVTLCSKGETKEVRSRIAIAADGVNSRITASLGLNKERKFLGTPRIVSWFLEGATPEFPQAFISFSGKCFFQTGYFMPKAPRKKDDPPIFELVGMTEAGLKRFMTEGNYASWFEKAKVIQKRAAVLNFYSPIPEPVVGNVMIVGDAASFIEVYIQGAIMYGYRAAKAAARQLNEGNGFAEYVDYWKESYEYNKIVKMEEACRMALGLPTLKDEELDYLFALVEPEKIKSYYDEFCSYQVLEAVTRHIPRIRRENPQLADKIETMFQASLDDILQLAMKELLNA